eukprot:scaffold10576_cov115-Isochrysis_galbana.AAC.6
MAELAAAPTYCKFMQPAAQPGQPPQRSIQLLLEFMEPLWRLTFQCNGIRGGRRGHTADGVLRVADQQYNDEWASDDEPGLLLSAVYLVAAPPMHHVIPSLSPK